MNYIEEIKKYKPYNIQEEKDKEFILKCINDFDNILTRENIIVHITSSGYIVNKDFTKVLMVFHNIYNTTPQQLPAAASSSRKQEVIPLKPEVAVCMYQKSQQPS